MNITPINTLPALREVLQAPAEHRKELFLQKVMEPLRPTWEPMLAYMPHDRNDPALSAAQITKMYLPDMDAETGLKAIAELENAQVFQQNQTALEQAIQALKPEQHGIQLPDVHLVLTLAAPGSFGEDGVMGAGNTPGWVMLSVSPQTQNWDKLPAITAHEFNHNVRFQQPDWSFPMSLGAYLVAEGLAENFAAELHGPDSLGTWTTTLQEPELRQLAPRYQSNLLEQDFNVVRGYIFGDNPQTGPWQIPSVGIPPYAGYALGYHLVRDYLRHTGKTAAEAIYTPWREIVNGSGWMTLN